MTASVIDRRVGWALVGCGWVARDFVIPAIDDVGGELVVVCDRDARALALLPANIATTTDLDLALATHGVDAVYVATPNDAHADTVRRAAAAGKHVLCEKPMATTRDDAVGMVDACRRAGVRYATAFDQRFHAAHRRLARLVRDGELGTPTQARIHYACWLPPDWSPTGITADRRVDQWRIDPLRAGGGALVDLAPHGVDLLETVLGDVWSELSAITQSVVHPYAVDDGAVLMGRMRSGLLATLHVAYNCPDVFPRRVLEIIGTRARAVAIDTMGQTPGGSLQLTDAATGTVRAIDVDDDRSPFAVQIEAFVRSLRGDAAAWPWSAEDDLRRFALLDAARLRAVGAACR